MKVNLRGNTIDLSACKDIGKGGEAIVYKYRGEAIKIYHPMNKQLSVQGKQKWKDANKLRIEKLKNFPDSLPDNVIIPQALVYDSSGQIVGYTMRFIDGVFPIRSLGKSEFRKTFDVKNIIPILLHLLKTVQAIHKEKVIIGDLNDLNELAKLGETYFIDTESMQFGPYPCIVASEMYLDPCLYGKNYSSVPMFTKETDYYALAVMIFRSLLMVHPYGGIHPDYTTVMRRAENRVSIFDPKVVVKNNTWPYGVLPDELLNYFSQIFDKGERNLIDSNLLEAVRWTHCTKCGMTHARTICPGCAAPGAVKEVITVHGNCSRSRIFKTIGRILTAKLQGNKLVYLYTEGNSIRRERDVEVMAHKPNHEMQFAFKGKNTLVGMGSVVAEIKDGKVIQRYRTDKLGLWPVFDANFSDVFTVSGISLAKNDQEIVGSILPGQTWFKVGPTFGLGFYRVGKKFVYFLFDAVNRGINDEVDLPQFGGKIIDADCIFSDHYALFSVSREEGGKIINSIHMIDKKGKVVALKEAEEGSERSLNNIRGKAIGGKTILTATNEGLVLLAPENGLLVEAKHFPDTEPFVTEDSEIIPASDGIYVIEDKEISLLRMR